MRLLLDTHILIWAAIGDEKLSKAAAQLIDDEANTLYFSAASIWELTIKGAERTGVIPASADGRRSHFRAIHTGYRALR